MNEGFLRQLANNRDMKEALKEFFLSQIPKLLSEVDTQSKTNADIGEIHRGVVYAGKVVERAFLELSKYETSEGSSPQPMPGR